MKSLLTVLLTVLLLGARPFAAAPLVVEAPSARALPDALEEAEQEVDP